MSQTPGRAKRLESGISFCLLVALLLIALGVLIKQSHSDMSRFGINEHVGGPAAGRQTIGPAAADALSVAPAGYGAAWEVSTYTEESLYEKIDGKAPFYTDAGFEKLLTRRFSSKDNQQLSMELYVFDMGNIRNAFSVYSRQKRPHVEPLAGVRFGYRAANARYFVHGRYYCELVGSSEADELHKAMEELSKNVRKSLGVDGNSEMPELSLFPSEDLVPNSYKLFIGDAFGFDGLSGTFSAGYEIKGRNITAFISNRSSRQAARKLVERYSDFLIGTGGSAKQTDNEKLKALEARVIDVYGFVEIIFAAGPYTAGIHEAENQELAEEFASTLAEKLGTQGKLETNE